MSRRKFTNGMVVRAKDIPDRSAAVEHVPRPVLVTSVNKRAPFVAYVISTRKDNPDSDAVMEMPWDSNTGAGTGLKEWCALVLRWMVIVEPEQVENVSGQVTSDFLDRGRQLIREAKDRFG